LLVEGRQAAELEQQLQQQVQLLNLRCERVSADLIAAEAARAEQKDVLAEKDREVARLQQQAQQEVLKSQQLQQQLVLAQKRHAAEDRRAEDLERAVEAAGAQGQTLQSDLQVCCVCGCVGVCTRIGICVHMYLHA